MADVAVIHSVTKFCRELKVGDAFWHITLLHGEPYAVEGPCTVLKIFVTSRQSVMVRYARSWFRETEDIVEDAILDIVSNLRGVFLNASDAYAYFDERRQSAAGLDPHAQAHLADYAWY